MHALCSQALLLRRLASLPNVRQQPLAPLRCAAVAVRASVEPEANPTPAKRTRKAKPADPTSAPDAAKEPARQPVFKVDCGAPAPPQAVTASDGPEADPAPAKRTRKSKAKQEPVSVQDAQEPAVAAKASDGSEADPAPAKRKRSSKAKTAEPSSAQDAPQEPAVAASVGSEAAPAPAKGRRRSKAKPEPASVADELAAEPAVHMDCATPVLSQSANSILSMIQDHGYDKIREIMVDRGIKAHHTVLKHLLSLVDLGELDVKTVLKLHSLEAGPPRSLNQHIIEQALTQAKPHRNGVSKDQACLTLLAQQQPEAVRAQEAEQAGITLMQLDLVKALQKRKAILGDGHAGAADGGQGTWEDQLPLLLKSAERKRLVGYLQGKTLQEIQQPPYSRKQVAATVALDTLVSACKAGVKLPLDRVLHDFKLTEGPDGLSALEVARAVASILDLLSQGVQGYVFYEAARTKLLESPATRHKVEAQEAADPLGRTLTSQQARMVYYLTTAGELEKPAEWVEQERRFAALAASLH